MKVLQNPPISVRGGVLRCLFIPSRSTDYRTDRTSQGKQRGSPRLLCPATEGDRGCPASPAGPVRGPAERRGLPFPSAQRAPATLPLVPASLLRHRRPATGGGWAAGRRAGMADPADRAAHVDGPHSAGRRRNRRQKLNRIAGGSMERGLRSSVGPHASSGGVEPRRVPAGAWLGSSSVCLAVLPAGVRTSVITIKQNKCEVYKGGVEKAAPQIKKLAGTQMPGIMREVEHTHAKPQGKRCQVSCVLHRIPGTNVMEWLNTEFKQRLKCEQCWKSTDTSVQAQLLYHHCFPQEFLWSPFCHLWCSC
ncbi:uncharacterized protein LOC136008770 [Lathamus discolor]|uniref:uncharacterized protein LOC136008770 n=1 Tax=Lathamus discolor TaxID=678569 RepID=UPI0032B75CE4